MYNKYVKKRERKIKMTEKAIYFDMDGTIANLYGVEGWLADLRSYNERPYKEAAPMINMNILAKRLNKLHNIGYKIGIVSWLSKTSTIEYDKKVIRAKRKWLSTHLHSVQFDEIHIVSYGTRKEQVVEIPFGILFDDEKQNRENWYGKSFNEENILDILKQIIDSEK